MISWKEYLTILLDSYRENFDRLSEEEKHETQVNYTFVKPCQIEVLSFQKLLRDILLVSFDPKRPDKEFIINDRIKLDAKEYVSKRAQSDAIFLKYRKTFMSYLKKERIHYIWRSLEEDMSVHFFDNLREQYPDPKTLALERFEEERKEIRNRLLRNARLSQYENLSIEVKKLKEQLKYISDTNLRLDTLATTDALNSYIRKVKRIDKHEKRIDKIEKDIGGVRRIMGVSEKFQDWRIMASDLETLKKTHVAKELFQSEIKRLDQRIDSLKEIKFWSKRTLLEISLAIIAAIATLYGAGVIKF
jgi:hypothetical protein